MNKEAIISTIRGLLPREDKTQRFHPAVLEAVIEVVLKEMYVEVYKINPNLLDNYCKTYGADTPIVVSSEPSSGIYFSTLPSPIVNIPDKSSGVRHIYPIVQTGNVFVPMDARETDLIYNTDVAVVTSKIGYRVRQDTRVDYYHMSGGIIASGVRMDLLIPFSQYLDTDTVNIPELGDAGGASRYYQTMGIAFVDKVLKVLQVIPPADLSDDNAPAKGNQNTK